MVRLTETTCCWWWVIGGWKGPVGLVCGCQPARIANHIEAHNQSTRTHREPAVELAALDVVLDHLLDPVQGLLRHLVRRPELRQNLPRQPVADLVERWYWGKVEKGGG